MLGLLRQAGWPCGEALITAVISSVSASRRFPGQALSSRRHCKRDSRQSKGRQGGVWSHRQSPPRQAAGQQWFQALRFEARGDCSALPKNPDVIFRVTESLIHVKRLLLCFFIIVSASSWSSRHKCACDSSSSLDSHPVRIAWCRKLSRRIPSSRHLPARRGL